MSELLLDLPSHLRDRLATALESGQLGPSPTVASLRSLLGDQEATEVIAASLLELKQLGISGPIAAAWLRTIDRAIIRNRKPDLVWSGPEAPGLHARDTRRVYEELMGSAEQSVWASTYVFFDGPRAFEALARRMKTKLGLRVTLLLNIQRKKGDTTASEHLVRGFADHFWKTDWPGSIRPNVFYDPRALDIESPSGVLHAKAVVVDDEVVFITSANLTDAALDRNIELGILLHDRTLALSVAGYFRSLIDHGLLKPLPSTWPRTANILFNDAEGYELQIASTPEVLGLDFETSIKRQNCATHY
jgi:phosphatidylserine/phosphatidylglycerophosphate/cardiolipin synthase-like enzyme